MSDDRSPGRVAALIALTTGVLALVLGISVRVLALGGQGGLQADVGFLTAAVVLSALALAPAAWARPVHFGSVFILPWLGAAALAIVMLVLSLLEPQLRPALAPAALETAGGFALLIAFVRWRQMNLIRRNSWAPLNGQAKSEVHQDQQTSALVPASALVAKDEVRLQAGDRVPADGHLSSDDGRLNESSVMGPSRPVERKKGAPIFAGVVAEDPIRVRIAAPWHESWGAQRDQRHDKLRTELLPADRSARAAAVSITLIAVAVAGLAMTRAGPLAASVWMPTAAGVLLAAVAMAPALGRLRGRISFLYGLHRAGLIVSRMRDLRALMRVRRWHIDPVLLAAPGPVEAVAFDDSPTDVLLVKAEALTRERSGPLYGSVLAAVRALGLQRSEGAALRYSDGLYQGTVDGERWFLGRQEQVQAVLNHTLDVANQGPLTFFDDRLQTPYLIGRDKEGIAGVVGIGMGVEDDVRAAVRALQAKVVPSIPEAATLADRVGVPLQQSEPGHRDGTLMSEGTAPPKAGTRLRVLTPRAARQLPSAGSPRMMKPALAAFASVVNALRAHLDVAARTAWLAAAAGLGVSAALALLVGLSPSAGALIGAAAVWGASMTDAPAPDPNALLEGDD